MKKVKFTKSSEKELLKLNKQISVRIYNKIMLIPVNQKLVRSEKLRGGEGYRIRVGDYRVIYVIDKDVILVIRIRHRRDVYKQNL